MTNRENIMTLPGNIGIHLNHLPKCFGELPKETCHACDKCGWYADCHEATLYVDKINNIIQKGIC